MLLLDTNVLIYLAKGEPDVVAFLRTDKRFEEPLLIPTVIIVEFLGHPAFRNDEKVLLDKLLATGVVADLSLKIALHAAGLRSDYKLKLGDSVIAATAITYDATLVTRNIRDFRKIPHLDLQEI